MLAYCYAFMSGAMVLVGISVLTVHAGADPASLGAVFVVFAIVSMFCNPLRFLLACARGERPEFPR